MEVCKTEIASVAIGSSSKETIVGNVRNEGDMSDGENADGHGEVKKNNKVKIMTEIQTVHSDSRTAENISLLNYSKSENKNESVCDNVSKKTDSKLEIFNY